MYINYVYYDYVDVFRKLNYLCVPSKDLRSNTNMVSKNSFCEIVYCMLRLAFICRIKASFAFNRTTMKIVSLSASVIICSGI